MENFKPQNNIEKSEKFEKIYASTTYEDSNKNLRCGAIVEVTSSDDEKNFIEKYKNYSVEVVYFKNEYDYNKFVQVQSDINEINQNSQNISEEEQNVVELKKKLLYDEMNKLIYIPHQNN